MLMVLENSQIEDNDNYKVVSHTSIIWAQIGSARAQKQISEAYIILAANGDPSACPWTGDSW